MASFYGKTRASDRFRTARAVAGSALLLIAAAPSWAQTVTLSALPAADAFLWSLAPAANYGGTGALSISGASAVNGSGQQSGLYVSLMRFPMTGLAASLNTALGSNNWLVTGFVLSLTEVAAPANSMFNRGVGAFEIRWIASDSWLEGTGTPIQTTTDGVSYQDLSSVLNPALDVSLGQLTNSGLNGPIAFSLGLPSQLSASILRGTDVNLCLTAASPAVGFTFNSKDFPSASGRPSLAVTAVAKPLAHIDSVSRSGDNRVLIGFNTASNWTYVVQGANQLTGDWSNLLIFPPQTTNGSALFSEGATNLQKFYRLSVSQ